MFGRRPDGKSDIATGKGENLKENENLNIPTQHVWTVARRQIGHSHWDGRKPKGKRRKTSTHQPNMFGRRPDGKSDIATGKGENLGKKPRKTSLS